MGIEPSSGDKGAVHLSPRHQDLVQSLLRAHLPGVTVWAYGSRVKGNARRYSDLDLVAFTTEEQVGHLYELRHAFEESDLPFQVDLFAWREIPQSFRTQIMREYAVVQGGDGPDAEPDG